jgi:hypothetical protein
MALNSGFQVRIVEGPDEGEIIPLDHTRITIGRARHQGARATGWLLLYDKSVSREHAEFIWQAGQKEFHLRHLSKTNLTWVDENKLEDEIPVRAGQEFRVGKSRLVVEACAIDSSSNPGLEVPLAATGELTEKLHVGNLAATLALREDEAQTVKILSGPDQGEVHELKGFQITVGHECESRVGEGESATKYDQVINLKDPSLAPNHLILKWDALRKGFYLRSSSDAHVSRGSDGFQWRAAVPAKGGFLRPGDRIEFGESSFELRASGYESKELPAKSIALPKS